MAGSVLAFIISRVVLRFVSGSTASVQNLAVVHAISGIALAALSWFGEVLFGLSSTAFYFLVAWFLPQVLWFVWDMSSLTYKWTKTPPKQ